MKLSIIIPIYNEYNNIDLVINTITSVKLPPQITAKELILIDDGSNDGTREKLEKYKGGEAIIVHSSRINFGKGTATRIGLTYVTGDIVLIQDADLEYDPHDYPLLLSPIINGQADVVYGSRFLNNFRPQGMKFTNWLANQILKVTVNILYGAKLTDEATAYKMFRTKILKSLNLKAKRFEFCPEVTAKVLKKGYKIVEVPISYKGRSVKEGKKIKWYDGFEAIWALLKYRFLN
jgi:glycosyltransferase involved in cell wall biosynthesis